ncbi:MAG: hypothetical protein SOY04_02615 [Clostridium celatum]|nr:hypothetical protein [Clostridium celatum]
MKDVYNKIDKVKAEIEKIKDDNYVNIFNSFSDILESLSSKVEEVILHQEYLEENMEYIGDDLTDIQDELFEEVSFDDLSALDDEYIEISCKNCDKPIFVEQQALQNGNFIPCPFCGGNAK